MAIEQIPGVGPQNTDIATAVAAAVPTIAAITSSITTNAASAGLTNASITSAGNAAGWGATGPTTTQIAAAVPTLAQITSAITTNAASAGVTNASIATQVANNAPSPFNFVHLGTGTLNNVSTATVSFSSYRFLRIFWSIQTGSNDQAPRLRFNGDTTGNYPGGYFAFRSSAGNNSGSTAIGYASINLTPSTYASNQVFTGWCEVFSANASTFKPYTVTDYGIVAGNFNSEQHNLTGNYKGTSAITSVTLFCTNGQSFGADARNQFQVYGAN
jgi:hypothetical protein